jgi:hypothetical protein
MWSVGNEGSLVAYSGAHTSSSVSITLYSNASVTMGGGTTPIGTIVFTNVTFANGGATRAWSAGQYAAQ